jgi:hypothetical protein
VPATTVVALRAWRDNPGLEAWARKVIVRAVGGEETLSLRRRLACVQFEAERAS